MTTKTQTLLSTLAQSFGRVIVTALYLSVLMIQDIHYAWDHSLRSRSGHNGLRTCLLPRSTAYSLQKQSEEDAMVT